MSCDICGSNNFEFVTKQFSLRTAQYNLPVCICRNCGFVCVNPKPSQEEYSKINEIWYSKKYSLDLPYNNTTDYKFHKWKIVWERISFYFKGQDNINFLDVGAGQGWATEFLREKFKNFNSFSIEQSQSCIEYIRDILKGNVINVSIESKWPDYCKNKFDLVILRHTLEHLLDPKFVLKQIKESLNKNGGVVYLAVPNINGSPYMNLLNDTLRPVHLAYYSVNTFLKLTQEVGLSPIAFGCEGELWGLFNTKKSESEIKLDRNYKYQRKFILDMLKRQHFNNYKVKLKLFIKRFLIKINILKK